MSSAGDDDLKLITAKKPIQLEIYCYNDSILKWKLL